VPGEFEALTFAAREGVSGLTKLEIAQADVLEYLE
jgi:hypothetical protein